jgi:hypothetical protein
MSTGTIEMSATGPPPPPDILTLSEILSDHSLLVAKEQADGDALRSIGTTSVLGIKPLFVEWVSKGYPDNYPLLKVEITPPPVCSDGVVRSLPDYIDFCAGTTLPALIGQLQAKLPDIRVSFANVGGAIAAILSRV